MIAKGHRILAAMLIAGLAGTAWAQSDDDSAMVAEYSRKGADTCFSCHDEDAPVLELFHGKHAVPSDPDGPFGSGQLQCEACHGPGGAHAGRVRRGQERPAILDFAQDYPDDIGVENGMCLECHGGDIAFSWHSGPHGGDEVGCADCHSSHSATDPVLETATQAEVCGNCHQLEEADTLKAFSHPFFEDKMDCASCHSVHGDQVASSLARETVNDTCFQCHAEKRGPFLWEHAPVSEDCGLCHAPHGSNHPGMLTARAPLLCQGCHSQAGHPSVSYEADGLAGGTPSAFLLGQSCSNCHTQVHGSNHPSGSKLTR